MKELWKRTDQKPVMNQLKRRQAMELAWTCGLHWATNDDSIAKQALQWTGHCKVAEKEKDQWTPGKEFYGDTLTGN